MFPRRRPGLALDTALAREVAIKLPGAIIQDGERLARLESEPPA